ncbi:MAG: hypothetical protein JNG88_05260 [Phycisphaerales bacterium]|nr:hypothetical protein [Phycisphaerales bacterium]
MFARSTFIIAFAGVFALTRSAFSQTNQPSPLAGLAYDEPFFPGARHDAAIPTPDAVLGFRLGDKPATHAQIEAAIRAISSASRRCKLIEYAKTHEGRALYYVAISSEANIARLDAIRADAQKLADPRQNPAAQVDKLIDSMPAVAWMAYCIHGDEMSGSDAALALIYHLSAGTDDEVTRMLDGLVVLVDPLMNPDGRDRCIGAISQARTAQPDVDNQSLIHTGIWPSGRMNHYLFDLNRDWLFGTQPESRGRILAAGGWNPHYFVESHEMGSLDTFLFMPPREPINPNIPQTTKAWAEKFATGQAAAFNARGWRYYTGEWNEEWYPGYSGSWAALRCAIDNLYEQANIQSDAVRRPEGTLESYREAVHKQLVSSWSNLSTLLENRAAILRDFVAARRRAVAADAPFAKRVFAFPPSANASRRRALIDLLTLQGIELRVLKSDTRVVGTDALGQSFTGRNLPAGTLLVANRQPEAHLLSAMLEFDPRMSDEFLKDERRELLRFGRSRLYDITGWSIPLLFDAPAIEVQLDAIERASDAYAAAALPPPLVQPDSTVGFVIDGADDHSVHAGARLMERGVRVRAALKPFRFDDRDFARGSVVAVLKDNPAAGGVELKKIIAEVAGTAQVSAVGIGSGLGRGDLPDLGGENFPLLEQPRIAVIGRDPISPYSYGETWYQIDHVIGIRAAYLDSHQIDAADLRRYNVIVLPEGASDLAKPRVAQLKSWVEAGGTLIAIGRTAQAFAADGGVGATRQLGDVITKLDEHRQMIVREWEARMTRVDAAAVWSHSPPSEVVYPWSIGEPGEAVSDDEMKRRDAWRALFMPQGAILAGRCDDRSYVTFGSDEMLPVLYDGAAVLIPLGGAQAAVRLGVFVPSVPSASQPATTTTTTNETAKGPGWTLAPPGYSLVLRMSGLLWPEAADRVAHTAYATREPIGNGQIVLFASSPTFRAGARGTTRLLSNVLIYGPGLGASHPIRP